MSGPRCLVSELFKQLPGLDRPLAGGQFQPVTGLLRLAAARQAEQFAQFKLGTHVAGARRLAQQLQTDTAITRVATVAAEQFPQTALGLHHTLHGGLLEQAAGKTLDAKAWPRRGLSSSHRAT